MPQAFSILGLDIDGTITAYPEYFSKVSRAWRNDGGKIHIVSSRSPEGRRETLQELRHLGICFDVLWLCPDAPGTPQPCPHTSLNWYQRFLWRKVDYALGHRLCCFYDDDPAVVELFRRFAAQIRINPDWPGPDVPRGADLR